MNASLKRTVLPLFLFVFWVILILVGYYLVHKPFTAETIAAPLVSLIDLVIALAVTCLAGGLGRRILKADVLPALERMAVHAALGAGILAIFWLLLGVLQLYRPLAAWVVLIAGMIWLRREMKAWFADFGVIKEYWKESPGFEKGVVLAGLALVVNRLMYAMAPPVKWDGLMYHLQLPRIYIEAGGFQFVPTNPYWGFPQITEMLYTWAALLNRFETAGVLSWCFGVMLLLGVVGFSINHLPELAFQNSAGEAPPQKRVSKVTVGWVAGITLLVGDTFRFMLGWSYVDLIAALTGLAILILFFQWIDTHHPTWILWTGGLVGIAIGTKWTAGVIVLGLLLMVWLMRKQNPLPLKAFVQAGGLALLMYLPWALKNLFYTGNIVYPVIFATQWVDAERLAQIRSVSNLENWWKQIFLPLFITWEGVDSAAGYSTDLGALIVLFALPGLWIFRHSTKARTLLVTLLGAWFFIGVVGTLVSQFNQTRLYFAVLGGLAAAAGWGWFAIQNTTLYNVRLRVFAGAFIVFVLALVLWQDANLHLREEPTKVVFGVNSREQYLENNLAWYMPAMQALTDLPAGSKTMMLWETRGLYAPSNAQPDPWIDQWQVDLRHFGTPDRILQEWQSQGFTHVLVYNSGVEFLRGEGYGITEEEWTALEQSVRTLPRVDEFGESYSLYSLDKD